MGRSKASRTEPIHTHRGVNFKNRMDTSHTLIVTVTVTVNGHRSVSSCSTAPATAAAAKGGAAAAPAISFPASMESISFR